MTEDLKNRFVGPAYNFMYKTIRVADMEEENLLDHLEDTNAFIEKAIDQGGSVLVHCRAGVSRSATVMIAYTMHRLKCNVQTAFKHVKSKRFIMPNAGFMD